MFEIKILTFVTLAFYFLCSDSSARNIFRSSKKFPTIGEADNYLRLYALPTGQGDSLLIQCPAPGGEITISDMGSKDSLSGGNLWKAGDVKRFIGGQLSKIRTILITHNHGDHFNLIDDVFETPESVSQLSNLHISCTEDHLDSSIKKWIEKFDLGKKVSLFNGGQPCGPNGKPCGIVNICPKSKLMIEAKILISNWGQQCSEETSRRTAEKNESETSSPLNKNTDSSVMMLKVGKVKIMLNGDFEDFTSSRKENGPIRSLVDFYQNELQSDIYQLSHHGAVKLANKDILLERVKPKAIFISSNPYARHRHPRCKLIDKLIEGLCKPMAASNETSFCGEHPMDNSNLSKRKLTSIKLQRKYTCGEEGKDAPLRNVTKNQYSIYSTVPDLDNLNLVELRTDGKKWGFINNQKKKIN